MSLNTETTDIQHNKVYNQNAMIQPDIIKPKIKRFLLLPMFDVIAQNGPKKI